MDEILSSIRQIIADDDAGGPPARPPAATKEEPIDSPPEAAEGDADSEALALSAEQILHDGTDADDEAAASGSSFDEILGAQDDAPGMAGLVDPDDIAFAADQDSEEDLPEFPSTEVEAAPEPAAAAKPAARMADAAPMPDPQLSEDLADELLEPATESAVQSTFARLNGMSAVGTNVTIEQMMREMLRPMLKEWLDENLPTVVERMVEKEIARAARGGR
ncbi:DUF2497 domain-containing protein [Devosia sp.]|uniref:DUF2497 domain-containing protein n=1 Tax=Devosia sp. TaxID=1871048 RepID=UPI003A93E497